MKKIALIRRNGLGDLLCSFPTLIYLKTIYSDARFTLFVEKRNEPLLRFLPYSFVDPIVLPCKGNRYLSYLKMAFCYRREHYDMAISLKTSPMKLMNFFLFALGAKQRLAYVGKDWHNLLINHPRKNKTHTLHQALKSLQLFDENISEIPRELYPKAFVSKELMEKYCPAKNAPVLLLSATTTQENNRLSPKVYAEVVNELSCHHDFTTWIVGQREDEERAKSIASYLKTPFFLYFPRNFDEFMVLLNASDLFFVGDGGIGHIGAALGKAGVVLFGGSHPDEWRPLSENFMSLYHPFHVERLSKEEMVAELQKKFEERICGRNDVRSRLGLHTCKSISTS